MDLWQKRAWFRSWTGHGLHRPFKYWTILLLDSKTFSIKMFFNLNIQNLDCYCISLPVSFISNLKFEILAFKYSVFWSLRVLLFLNKNKLISELKCTASPYKSNTCYTFGQIKQSLETATETCRSSGGFLAIPNTLDEISFLQVIVGAMCSVGHRNPFLCYWVVY